MRRAVFVDKDNTLVVDVPFDADPAHVRLMPRAAEGLRTLAQAGYHLFVVSNQPGVALGRFGADALPALERRIRELLEPQGVAIDAFYWCPHHPDGTVRRYAVRCTCRKPEPGMLLRAAAAHGLDLAGSWVVGDILDDVGAGRRAGCRTVLVDNGGETEWRMAPWRTPHHLAADLAEAARAITRDDVGAENGREEGAHG